MRWHSLARFLTRYCEPNTRSAFAHDVSRYAMCNLIPWTRHAQINSANICNNTAKLSREYVTQKIIYSSPRISGCRPCALVWGRQAPKCAMHVNWLTLCRVADRRPKFALIDIYHVSIKIRHDIDYNATARVIYHFNNSKLSAPLGLLSPGFVWSSSMRCSRV